MIDNRWYSVLDDFEDHLDGQLAALTAGRAGDIVAFPLPAGLGPLPPNLRPRADRLAQRAMELEELASRRLDQLSERLAAIPRQRRAAAQTGRLFNHTA